MVAALVFSALPANAAAATRFVAETGSDGPSCGADLATACRSITQALALAAPGDTVIVGPGRYGDLNLNSTLGDYPGEETGSPGCSCVLSMNKNVILVSSDGASTTLIDGTGTNVVQTVVVLSSGGEFGRPGKGFTVTQSARFDEQREEFTGHGIGIDAANVKVRGNQVVFTASALTRTTGIGIFTVNSAAVVIEGNRVLNWRVGIQVIVPGAAIVSGNEVIGNQIGIDSNGGTVVRNVATGNLDGYWLRGPTTAMNNTASKNGVGGFSFQVFASFSGRFTQNNMFSNARLETLGCGVFNNGVPGLDATNNYWGSADGPGLPPADQTCGAATETAPFATKPFKVKILRP